MKEEFQTVRLRRILLQEFALIAEQTKHSVPELIHMVMEDSLVAVKTRCPIMPRMARLAAAVEKDVAVKDPKSFLFMGTDASGVGRLREEPESDAPPPPGEKTGS